ELPVVRNQIDDEWHPRVPLDVLEEERWPPLLEGARGDGADLVFEIDLRRHVPQQPRFLQRSHVRAHVLVAAGLGLRGLCRSHPGLLREFPNIECSPQRNSTAPFATWPVGRVLPEHAARLGRRSGPTNLLGYAALR